MATTVPAREDHIADVDDKALTREIVTYGSSWAAFCLAVKARPVDLPELLRKVGVYDLARGDQRRAFDACVDGYTVFHDARMRRKL